MLDLQESKTALDDKESLANSKGSKPKRNPNVRLLPFGSSFRLRLNNRNSSGTEDKYLKRGVVRCSD
jgi:hypothetical protein